MKALSGPPVVGHLLDFRSRRLELLRRVAEECGDLGLIRLGPLRAVVVSSARLSREVLTERHHEFSRVPLQGMDGLKALFGDGMLVADGDKHAAQRKRVMSAFSRKRIQANAAVVASEADAWQASLIDGQELDLFAETDRLTRRIARRTLFGMSGSAELDEGLEQALTQSAVFAMAELMRLVPLPGWIPSPHNVGFRRIVRALDERILTMVQRRRANPAEGDDALSVLVNEAERGLTDRELRDDLMSLFVAGNEASSAALFWCLHHLVLDAELAERLGVEANGALSGLVPGGGVEVERPLATAIYRESLRLYPAAHVIIRRTASELELGGARVPKDVMVMINGYMIHRDAAVYERPDQFHPSRFLENARALPTSHYFPFGAGPRTCIGNHFATLQGPLALSVIHRALRFEPLSSAEVRLSTGFAIVPAQPYRVRVRRVAARRASSALPVGKPS
jgi:cytochrome P450